MIFVVIFCEFGRTYVFSVVAAVMMLMVAATAFKVTMHILLVDASDKLFLLIVELFQPACVFNR